MNSQCAPAKAAGKFNDVQVWWLCRLDRDTYKVCDEVVTNELTPGILLLPE